MPALRIGLGFDLHRLAQGRRLVLGGVTIPFEKGLLGHSDADALCHAAADALLGALALGDLGQHFSDTDPAWKDADSLLLLGRVAEMVEAKGFRVVNLDATLIAEAPRLSPHFPAMAQNLARVLKVSADRVSVKAKTLEGTGEIGRGEAIAAQVIVLLEARA
ncbi:MAG: 2-C-methyl-D-erythritol 2,4-cyclodiphosphate synthase [Deltaproteobacteria bacterium RBG_13_61_14]|nr:MAG: 2-C-methyl-D-erythritol 2,4-cyclodiphosphate synthase [Deltaproteobacteria bacterium RBG_13_61_14]